MPPETTPPPQTRPNFNFWETDPNRNFAPWFLKFCLALIIIGVALAGYSSHQTYKTHVSNVVKARNGMLAANWQTYRNEEYGFEFKYPTNFQLTIDRESAAVVLTKLTSMPEVAEHISESLIVTPIGLKNPVTLCDIRTNISFNSRKAEQCINEAEFYYQKIIKIKDLPPGWEVSNIIFIDLPKFEGAEIVGQKELFDQILSTFKFTK